jgi:fused signal recognition particle receptor
LFESFTSIKKKISDISEKIRHSEKEPTEGAKKIGIKERTKALVKGEAVLDEKKLEDIFFEFETALLESDVALEVSEKITGDLKKELHGRRVKRGGIDDLVRDSIKRSLKEILSGRPEPLDEQISKKRPYVIMFIGVNGTGKTTTVAKIAHLLKKKGLSCVIAASDTFRAGAIEQLERHAKRLDVRMIKHEKGADSAAVAFDAIEHAKARGKDAVLVDTAGRMETNVNLMDEMKKIMRVAKPDLVMFVGDALTGNSAVEQARRFNDAVKIDGIILTKADADARGGAAISIAHVINKPIYFFGTGQEYDDLMEFDPEWFIDRLVG